MSSRLRILVSAYACEPDRGSEPGVGWNWVQQIARHNDVWVITRANNRGVIERYLEREPLPNARFVYFDLPKWARFWKHGRRGLYLYYYLWQIGAYVKARHLHNAIQFHIAHHVTFVTYWMPSFFALLPIPFVWGPVGGGESTPPSFLKNLPIRGILFELMRSTVQAIGRMDPFVRLTARKSAVAFATTPVTAGQMSSLGCRNIQVHSAMGLPPAELGAPLPHRDASVFRLIGMGDLTHWKGSELGLRAFESFARDFPTAEYWFVGHGFERRRLERLARELQVADRVRFWGHLARPVALSKLNECDVLVHPSLHDSGGCVCSEALAAGRPVICLDLGGPALQVTPGTGFKIAAHSPAQAINDLASAMRQLASDPELRSKMSAAAQEYSRNHLAWDLKGDRVCRLYRELVQEKITDDLASAGVRMAAGEY
jgi:glycosyltransferase involved in cell wall biosynthesis